MCLFWLLLFLLFNGVCRCCVVCMFACVLGVCVCCHFYVYMYKRVFVGVCSCLRCLWMCLWVFGLFCVCLFCCSEVFVFVVVVASCD